MLAKKAGVGIVIGALAGLAFASIGAQSARAALVGPVADTQKTNYLPNSNFPHVDTVNVTDPFEFSGTQAEQICVGFYVFDENEQLQECCGCPISNDGLLTVESASGISGPGSISAPGGDLVSNPFASHNGPLNFANVKLISFNINPPNPVIGGQDPLFCDATGGIYPEGQYPFPELVGHGTFVPLTLTPSLRAWATHFQNQANLTESEFRDAPLLQTDANSYAQWCGAIQFSGSGRGVCSCGTDASF